MIMIVITPGSQMAPQQQQKKEERRWEVGGGRVERSEVQARSTLTLTAPKARVVATLDEVPRISLRVSSKLPSLTSSLLSSVITALARTSACPGTTAALKELKKLKITKITTACDRVIHLIIAQV